MRGVDRENGGGGKVKRVTIREFSWRGMAGSASWMTISFVVVARHIYKYVYFLYIDFD